MSHNSEVFGNSSLMEQTQGTDNPSHVMDNGRTDAGNIEASANQSPALSSQSNRSSVYKTVIYIKMTYRISLIIASIIMLTVSRHEKSRYPLFAWIAASTTAHVLSLPIIFRHYFLPYPRLYRLVDRFYWMLELFFAIWFVVGNYWVLRESSFSQANKLLRCCIALLICDYIKYVAPCLLRLVILCCRDLLKQTGGAPAESINSLPTYKFKLHKSGSERAGENHEMMHEVGVIATGTERERAVTREDAVCCICLSSYDDNDELKELPCSHFFHSSCVDMWLKIKAFCPLCRCGISQTSKQPTVASNPSDQV